MNDSGTEVTIAPKNTTLPAKLVLGGAALLLIGSFLPWAKVSVALFDATVSQTIGGMDGDGPITLVAAIALGALGWILLMKGWHKGRLIGTVCVAALATLVAVIDLLDVNRVAGSEAGLGIDVSIGIGLWVVTVAAITALAGSILALRDKPVA